MADAQTSLPVAVNAQPQLPAPTAPVQSGSSEGLTPLEAKSLRMTLVSTLVAVIIAGITGSLFHYRHSDHWALLALSVGALGGLAHEFAQS